jgi:nitroimidazol reductase NimA-like FMN-containing flavoprotein (pyridoxamine 5'-phosphate oxidase superfamily)
VKRLGERGRYDRETIEAIIDEALLCHVGTVEDGVPMVIPTLHARDGDHLILHGSVASRMLRTARTQEICVTVTLVDGFVLARSALHHSMNYRSVVLIGRPEVVPDEDKDRVLDLLVERLVPGRMADLRPNTDAEVRQTSILRLSISEASAKVRAGQPSDDEADYALPVWAGVLPISTVYGPPIPDPAMADHLAEVPEPPAYISDYRRP